MKIARFAAFLLLPSLALYAQQGVPRLNTGPYRVFASLRAASAELRSDGFQEHQPAEGGVLQKGRVATMRLALEAGRTYQILGLCDENCSNLDLSLLDPSGALLDSDNAQDDLPLVSARPGLEGIYRLRVTMQECSTAACFFAVAVVVR